MASQNSQARRLSQRRGSMAAPDPFLQHEPHPTTSSSSRITIVRVPSVKDNTPPSPGYQPRDGLPRSDRDPGSVSRRSSWGSAKSGGSDSSGGRGRGRMSFAFATFTPIEPPSTATDRAGPTSGPSSPVSFRSNRRSFSNAAPASPPRAAALSPQQLYEVAQQATNPSKINPTVPVYGYGGTPLPAGSTQNHDGGIQPAPFVPLPSEVYLPFIQRPQEVSQLLSTPQTGRLFALLASTFPQDPSSKPLSRPPSSASIKPQLTGGSVQSIHIALSDFPEDPKTWSFSQLSAWLRGVTRQEADDREWVRRIRACINARSEVLWQRFAGALGVPPGFEDEDDDNAIADEEDISGSESRFVGIGRTDHSSLAASIADNSSEIGNDPESQDVDSDQLNSEVDDFEDEYEDSSLPGSSAIIEPITASSLPPPPSASGLTSPPPPPSGMPGDTHPLTEVREEEEEAEDARQETGSGVPIAKPIPSSLPKHLGGLSSSLGSQHEYVPRTPSPLATPAKLVKTESVEGRPALQLSTPTLPVSSTIERPSPPEEHPSEREIDFGEPDPNAEAIQGLRIMNTPMVLFPTSLPGSAARFVDGDNYATSPAQSTPPQSVLHSGLPAVPVGPGNRARAGSNSSAKGSLVHYRTQSFGAYRTRRGSGSSLSQVHLGGAGLVGNAERVPGNPLFPSSFASLSMGPTLSVNNPRLRNPSIPTSSAITGVAASGRHAGISLGAGMHHTPRPVAKLREALNTAKPMSDYAVSESDQ